MSNHIRYWIPKIAAIALAMVFLGLARLPTIEDAERQALASQFRFARMPLAPEPAAARSARDVHGSFTHLSAWISSVGASIALGDLDGDGLSNDACHVDPREDTVTVLPVPGTGARYAAFHLAHASGSSTPIAPMGCRLGDFNDDGLIDALAFYWGRTPVVFLRRSAPAGQPLPPPGAPQFAAVEIVPGDAIWNTNALTTADVDGDGGLDLVVGNYFQDGAVMLDPRTTTRAEMQNSMARAYNGGVNRLLLNEGGTAGPEPTVRFRDVPDAFSPEIARGWTLAVGAADLDGDLLPELYFANDFGPDRLLHNRSQPGLVRFAPVFGRRSFWTPNSSVLGRDSFKGMGVDFGDLNGDGRFDIYVSNIANEYGLQESHFAFLGVGDMGAAFRAGRAPFEEASDRLGLARSGFSWEARLADYNNDGVPEAQQAAGFIRGTVNRWPELQELAMGNNLTIKNPRNWPRFDEGGDISGHLHNPFFVRSSSGRYFDLAADVGIDHPQVARGIAVADVDGDGDLDFAVARQWEPSDFYRNDSPASSRGLVLQLRVLATRATDGPGAALGRPAVGATVRATLPDGRRLVAQVDGGSGHGGARATEVHLGLGSMKPGSVLPVEIHWRGPDGRVHRDTRTFRIDEPDSTGRPMRHHVVLLTGEAESERPRGQTD